MTAGDAHRAILAVWRIEQPRLITSLARTLRDVALAEELTQEALALTVCDGQPSSRGEVPVSPVEQRIKSPGKPALAATQHLITQTLTWLRQQVCQYCTKTRPVF
jgi:hypothetical protein